ncbi:Hypothetical predicted protein [Podarcis lilfordi]|uniref:Uncharacterized protein n=1 Tax=Podarcis lilfordi TaxID=74358 RepID=A0AA35KDF5_9SAUR|nr:Hypothetical predicted protein [Podarcis lilfordi]
MKAPFVRKIESGCKYMKCGDVVSYCAGDYALEGLHCTDIMRSRIPFMKKTTCSRMASILLTSNPFYPLLFLHAHTLPGATWI